MKHEEHSWKATDGLQMFAQSWAPDNRSRAVIALVHGVGDHSGRYPRFVELLTAAGYAISAFDLRGHGRTGGPRGHAPSYDLLMKDIDKHIADTWARFTGLPLILYGHSFGGAQVLRYILERNDTGITAVVASSPGLGSAVRQPAVKIMLAKILSHLAPTMTVPLGSSLESLSHDPAWLRITDEDPLFLKKGFSMRLAREMLRANPWILGHESFPLPLLVMQGTADGHVDPQTNIDFAKRLSGEVTLKIWPGLGHELHNEIERDAVIAFARQWMDAHIG
jgi:alpha-beta hydrolase superfamily lysophospholipase